MTTSPRFGYSVAAFNCIGGHRQGQGPQFTGAVPIEPDRLGAELQINDSVKVAVRNRSALRTGDG